MYRPRIIRMVHCNEYMVAGSSSTRTLAPPKLGSLVVETALKEQRLTMFVAVPIVGKHLWTSFPSHKTKRITQMKSEPHSIHCFGEDLFLAPARWSQDPRQDH